jgi:hypothetical protein
VKFHPTISAAVEHYAATLPDPSPIEICDALRRRGMTAPPSVLLQYLQKWHRELYPTDAAHMGKRWRQSKLCPRER